MSDIKIQTSFNSGEWSDQLFGRVDLQKYHSGAALLENFFVDYRGGAATRAGTKYIIEVYDTTHPVRLIQFQAAFNTGYCCEFGHNYVRFIYQGSPIVNTPLAITAATNANPCVITVPGNTYTGNDWIFVAGVGGMTQLNGRYFKILNVTGNLVTLDSLAGVPVDSTGYGTYTSGGTAASIYIIHSPYAGSDLALLKFAQTNNVMVLTHPSYAPQTLTLFAPTNWVLAPIVFGTTAGAPTIIAISTSIPNVNVNTTPYYTFGSAHYSYCVTSIDGAGQESLPSNIASVGPVLDYRTQWPGSNTFAWNPVAGAVAYNAYASQINFFGAQPPGSEFGFIGVCTTTSFTDDNIGPDFSQTVPVVKNPFVGLGISFVTVTSAGTYTTVPTVSFSGGSPSIAAAAIVQLGVIGSPTLSAGGTGYIIGNTINFGYGITATVTALSGTTITALVLNGTGSITSGSTPGNPLSQITSSGPGTGAQISVTWGVVAVIVLNQGAGYSSTPTVVFSAGAAAATVTLSATGNGNPSCCSFFQQRLVLAGPLGSPQTFYLSQPGAYYNFNITFPVQPDNAITGTLVSTTVNTIKSVVSVPAGMLIFTDKAAWVVNGGGSFQGISAAVTPATIVATAQSFIGANDMPPIISNYDILFVQSKGSQVRDLAYNIYFNVFTGTDVSLISNQLFYGYTLSEWAWAEQPYFMVWAVRDDGVMLTLTFLKEQEFVAWTHQTSVNGLFKSVCVVTEPTTTAGTVDAVYTVVERVYGATPTKYIERVAERNTATGLGSAWTVDCGLQYIGTSTLAFQGAEQLGGFTVTGLAEDNLGNWTVITPFIMPISGEFTLPAPTPIGSTGYTQVTVGLGFTSKLQTLPLDVGEPSDQGKPKKIPYVDIRVHDTIGLSVGSSFNHLTPMKDLIPGNVGSQLLGQDIQIVNGLYSGHARTFLDPTYTIPGQYCFQQSQPYPASILAVFPAYVPGDDR